MMGGWLRQIFLVCNNYLIVFIYSDAAGDNNVQMSNNPGQDQVSQSIDNNTGQDHVSQSIDN